MGQFYAPDAAGGLLYDDPRLRLSWPLSVTVISEKDQRFAPLDQCEGELKQLMSVRRGSA
jgi:dTDP-4-dehydrorhamnose 3,5-epimerase